MKINKADIKIKSACDVDQDSLFDFYQAAYPNRIHSLKSDWRWLNRTDFYVNRIPLVLSYHNKVIAHSGMMPFNFSVNGQTKTASWFIDFKVLDEFQRQGLGALITKKWMDFSACSLASPCNNGSIAVFKKLGWVESPDTFMHYNILKPFSHPKLANKLPVFIQKALNAITFPVLFLIYCRHPLAKASYKLEKMDERLFNTFYELYKNTYTKTENTFMPIRDKKYVEWRVLNSPNKNKYYLYEANEFGALVLLQNGFQKYIDILWVTNTNEKGEISKMISNLGIYGMKKGYLYIRFYTSKKELSEHIKSKTRSIVRHPRFAYFLQDKSTLNLSGGLQWDLELLDNDFENFH